MRRGLHFTSAVWSTHNVASPPSAPPAPALLRVVHAAALAAHGARMQLLVKPATAGPCRASSSSVRRLRVVCGVYAKEPPTCRTWNVRRAAMPLPHHLIHPPVRPPTSGPVAHIFAFHRRDCLEALRQWKVLLRPFEAMPQRQGKYPSHPGGEYIPARHSERWSLNVGNNALERGSHGGSFSSMADDDGDDEDPVPVPSPSAHRPTNLLDLMQSEMVRKLL
jgi:hypothetical protein